MPHVLHSIYFFLDYTICTSYSADFRRDFSGHVRVFLPRTVTECIKGMGQMYERVKRSLASYRI